MVVTVRSSNQRWSVLVFVDERLFYLKCFISKQLQEPEESQTLSSFSVAIAHWGTFRNEDPLKSLVWDSCQQYDQSIYVIAV